MGVETPSNNNLQAEISMQTINQINDKLANAQNLYLGSYGHQW